MFKKKLLPLTLVLLVSSLVKAEAKIEIKTGYFNSAMAVSESKTGKAAYAEIEAKRMEFANSFKKSEEIYTKRVQDLQAKASTLSIAARDKAESELFKMKRELENKAKEYEEELKLSARQTQERLGRELQDSIYEVGRKEGYDIMVDVMSGRIVVINNDKVDNTISIVTVMDSSHDKNSTAKKTT